MRNSTTIYLTYFLTTVEYENLTNVDSICVYIANFVSLIIHNHVISSKQSLEITCTSVAASKRLNSGTLIG